MPTLGEIVEFVRGSYSGPTELQIAGVATLADAGELHVSFLGNPKYASQVESSRAAAILVEESAEGLSPRLIRVKNPYFAMASVVDRWFASRPRPEGISPLAFIAPTAKIGRNVGIAPFVTVGENAVVGDDAALYSGVTLEPESQVGEQTILYPNVSVYYRCRIGKRCIVHSGAVIGSDGYGFATEGGRHHKIPQVGIVRIEDDVEIGAGTTIDRAALGETVIGEGTKIDNQVQIGHNVKIGKHVLLVAQVGIAGSAELGDYVVIAGQSGVAGHLKVGRFAQVAAKTAVYHDVPEKAKVMGIPAVPFRDAARRDVWIKRLPEMARRIEELEEKLGEHK